jgi:isoamylase
MNILTGKPYPLGASYDGLGVNFALFSENARRVILLTFDNLGTEHQHQLLSYSDGIWHGYLPGARPGLSYGYKVDDCSGVLLDPYARALNSEGAAIVTDIHIESLAKPRLEHEWSKTVIYEAHVKGLTMTHPDVPELLRGKFLGVCSKAIIDHLLSLGVTALQHLPVQFHLDEEHLQAKNLTNYWGYNTLAYFVPDARFVVGTAPDDGIKEFRQMVRKLHAAGIEVILDIVLNHSAEGSEEKPALSFRGIDNRSYYRTLPETDQYQDLSGCGNTFSSTHPRVIQFFCDVLRYWVQVCEVDGFRFDLLSAVSRVGGSFSATSPLLTAILQDPILSTCKLIAEPWDITPSGYQLGRYPLPFREWNDYFRDQVRDFWRSTPAVVSRFADALTASSGIFHAKCATSSINFTTAHDGFTLCDLVSYNEKHNQSNLEDNRDGSSDNKSWNCGVEGEEASAEIKSLRLQQQKNLLISLFFSLGVPMLLSGDELGRSQHGNNNAYCQDNETSWINWDKIDFGLLDFVRKLSALRREYAVLQRNTFYAEGDLKWLHYAGKEMDKSDWSDAELKTIGMFVPLSEGSSRGLINIFHAGEHSQQFNLSAEFKSIKEVISSSVDSLLIENNTILLTPFSSVILLCNYDN